MDFISNLSEGGIIFPLVHLLFTIVYSFIPKRVIFHKCETHVIRDDSETYEKNKLSFLTDYDRSNPITSKEATLAHLDLMESQETADEELENLKDRRVSLLQQTVFASIQKYGQNRSLKQRVKRIFGQKEDIEVQGKEARGKVFNKFFQKAALKRKETMGIKSKMVSALNKIADLKGNNQ